MLTSSPACCNVVRCRVFRFFANFRSFFSLCLFRSSECGKMLKYYKQRKQISPEGKTSSKKEYFSSLFCCSLAYFPLYFIRSFSTVSKLSAYPPCVYIYVLRAMFVYSNSLRFTITVLFLASHERVYSLISCV